MGTLNLYFNNANNKVRYSLTIGLNGFQQHYTNICIAGDSCSEFAVYKSKMLSPDFIHSKYNKPPTQKTGPDFII